MNFKRTNIKFQEKETLMTILDAQLKDARRARAAIVGLLSRGAYIKAFYKVGSQDWRDYHLITDGRRHEANQAVLKGIAESGKATIIDNYKKGFTCFYAPNLSLKGRAYVDESS